MKQALALCSLVVVLVAAIFALNHLGGSGGGASDEDLMV